MSINESQVGAGLPLSLRAEFELKRRAPTREQALEAVRTLISYIGDDVQRSGLIETPERVIKAWEQAWGLGYNKDWIEEQTYSIMKGQFEDGSENCSSMIFVRKISFASFCEHHLSLFTGTVDIAYIPARGGRILGLSKLVRVVNLFSHRLQVQERLTNQVADFIETHCNPIGVGVVVKASHSCMTTRGVLQHETDAVTSALRGQFLTQPEVRAEFLKLLTI